jgi:hypothetical protein
MGKKTITSLTVTSTGEDDPQTYTLTTSKEKIDLEDIFVLFIFKIMEEAGEQGVAYSSQPSV